jgi:hypothetical protein
LFWQIKGFEILKTSCTARSRPADAIILTKKTKASFHDGNQTLTNSDVLAMGHRNTEWPPADDFQTSWMPGTSCFSCPY